MRAEVLREKLARIRDGQPPRVLDLFAGCGGISLGCQLAGAKSIGGVEIDRTAIQTYASNFHATGAPNALALYAKARNIVTTDPHELVRGLCRTRTPAREIDLLVGGPPCQAFARIGRAKLREVASHPEAFLRDDRAELYRHYLRYVIALQPAALLIENVPDVLNYGGINLYESIAVALEKEGYEVRYGLLNSVHYGVPQMRDRCFLVAITKLARVEPRLPPATHQWELPRGYQGTRDVALKATTPLIESHYTEAAPASTRLCEAVTAEQAICDLPRITEHLRGKLKKAPRRLNEPVNVYPLPAGNRYLALMRRWPGFESDGFVYDHAIRYLPRDFRIFARMKAGDQYPEAYELANRMRDEAVRKMGAERGEGLSAGEIERLTNQYVPPYDPRKFPNKWRKMEADAPARTLTAHIGKDTYSHIHYESSQARTISVREAARLQSFPDGFRFAGTMNPAFRQIGNSVPPLLAHAVIAQLISSIREDGEFYQRHVAKLSILSREMHHEPFKTRR